MLKTWSSVVGLAVATATLIVLSVSGAASQTAADFYRDKTIRIIVPTGPGGDRALYTLVFANFFGQHIPGKPKIEPVFMPGAGGSVGLNYTFGVAQPDGLTIVTPLTSVLSAQVTNDPSVKYDAKKFGWIGRTADATRILYVSSKTAIGSLDALKSQQILVGSDGQASETFRNAAFMNNVFGTKFKIITGYDSAGSMNMAVDRGETQGAFTTWDDIHTYHPDWVSDGKVKLLLQIGLDKNPELSDVPLLLDLAKTDQDKELVRLMSSSSVMGQSFATPPGVSPAILETLRKAFDDTMKDLAFLEKVKAAKMHINPISGTEVANVVDTILNAPGSVMKRFQSVVSSTGQ